MGCPRCVPSTAAIGAIYKLLSPSARNRELQAGRYAERQLGKAFLTAREQRRENSTRSFVDSVVTADMRVA
jgi:hypothetical protein